MEDRDLELVEKARNGDELAFRDLVERHGANVFRAVVRITGNRETAEDIVQETFLKVHRQLHRFDHRARFATWLYRIAMNSAIDRKRKQARRARSVTMASASAIESVASPAPSQERMLGSAEIASAVRGVLAELSPRERAAFVLRHYEGCSIAEIGDILGLRTNACKSTIFRAVRKLRAALEPLVKETT